MLTQLRAIFDLIIQFQTTQETMYSTALAELEARKAFEKKTQQKTADVSSFSYFVRVFISIVNSSLVVNATTLLLG